MTTEVTQCPNCNTSFRVTESQLSIANGAVRCGSCLHIFNAPDHWLESQPTGQHPAIQPETSSEQEAPSTQIDNQSFDDDLLTDEGINNDSLDFIFEEDDAAGDDYLDELTDKLLGNSDTESTTGEFQEEINFSEEMLATEDTPVSEDVETANNAPENNPEDELDHINIDDYILSDDDQLIDDNLLSGDTKAESIINTDDDLDDLSDAQNDEGEETSGEFSSFFLELDQEEAEPAAVFKELDDLGDQASSDEEGWAKKLLDESDNEDDIESPDNQTTESLDDDSDDDIDVFFDSPNENQPSNVDPELLDILSDHENESILPVHEDEFILGEESLPSGERIGEDKYALLANIEPEPVELAAPLQTNKLLKRITTVAITATFALLAFQYVYFNFDRLSRDENFRPVVTKACHLLPCTLPALNDVSLIRSSNLVVRSHPTIEQALVVDAIMTNYADFKQQFPVMELQFTDLSGNVIAGRRFEPTEYLAGELVGTQTMPTKQPVHIALEIADPGEQAINYQMRFHSPKNG